MRGKPCGMGARRYILASKPDEYVMIYYIGALPFLSRPVRVRGGRCDSVSRHPSAIRYRHPSARPRPVRCLAGNNDAWKGYGGATVYTRHAALAHPPTLSAHVHDRTEL